MGGVMRRQRQGSSRAHRGGFSLVEVMVAVTLLGIGLLALGAVQMQAMTGVKKGRYSSEAAVIAQSRIETLHSQTWTALAPTAWTAPVQANGGFVESGGGTYLNQRFDISQRITNITPGVSRAIDVRVTWTEPGTTVQRAATFSSVRFNQEGL